MEMRGKSCFICYKADKYFIQNNSSIIDCLKVIYGTNKFDDTLMNGAFCLSCCGRVHQLYKFFVILFNVSADYNEVKTCFACKSTAVIREKNVIKEIFKFVQLSRLDKVFQQIPSTSYCCYSCFNFMDLYKELNDKLEVFEGLKIDLLSLETILG